MRFTSRSLRHVQDQGRWQLHSSASLPRRTSLIAATSHRRDSFSNNRSGGINAPSPPNGPSGLGIADLRFHDLRHDFATKLHRNGMGLDLIAALLGHATLAMTSGMRTRSR
ncbi:MAG: tyrosine-type recombinase/integrase [Gemmatimonadaceae bacterium]|nr:tyrosine-type recombinase/integrase [Gemmatimonadaceae bacterium]